jgi:hypothetical protein
MKVKRQAIKSAYSATLETGREGKGLTSLYEPSSGPGSASSCQPGKVASRRKMRKARGMAVSLKFSC